ncbi:MAG: hypothetical protein IPH09_03420 [bacterium]|nr:hypothetical protein [bacterium]
MEVLHGHGAHQFELLPDLDLALGPGRPQLAAGALEADVRVTAGIEGLSTSPPRLPPAAGPAGAASAGISLATAAAFWFQAAAESSFFSPQPIRAADNAIARIARVVVFTGCLRGFGSHNTHQG